MPPEDLQASRQEYWSDLEGSSLMHGQQWLNRVSRWASSRRLIAMTPERKANHWGTLGRWYHKVCFYDLWLLVVPFFWIFDHSPSYYAFVWYMLELGYLSESLDARRLQNACCFCLRSWKIRNHSTASKMGTQEQHESASTSDKAKKCRTSNEFPTHLSDKWGQPGLAKVLGLDGCFKDWWVVNLESFSISNPRNDMIVSFCFHVIQHEIQFVDEWKTNMNNRISVLDLCFRHIDRCHYLSLVLVKERGVRLLRHRVLCLLLLLK